MVNPKRILLELTLNNLSPRMFSLRNKIGCMSKESSIMLADNLVYSFKFDPTELSEVLQYNNTTITLTRICNISFGVDGAPIREIASMPTVTMNGVPLEDEELDYIKNRPLLFLFEGINPKPAR